MKLKVEKVVFQNEDNGYCVLACFDPKDRERITVVGTAAKINVGAEISCEGEWKFDPKYGTQFAATSIEEVLPNSLEGIERYLSSGLIKGIGKLYAKRIVRAFGEKTFDILDESPDALLSVPGIGKKRAKRIEESWKEQRAVRNIMMFLRSYDVSVTYAVKIYRQYGDNSIQVMKENPYRIADDIWGIGFKTADRIAQSLGIERDADIRLRSGILYTLSQLSLEGHVYAEKEQLIKAASELLEADAEKIAKTVSDLVEKGRLTGDVLSSIGPGEGSVEAIYLPYFYRSEMDVARNLYNLSICPSEDRLAKKIAYERNHGHPDYGVDIDSIQDLTGMEYDEVQAEAIQKAALSKVMVLTGGPGTGKTTTVNGIIAAFEVFGLEVLCAAPTGRASKRMSEATNMPAKTIHRLLEYKFPDGFERDEKNPLEGDVLIVDECSMIDLQLMNSLIKAIPDDMRLILVGDIDQLPSVGAGNVLRDIIDSDCIPVVRLTKIFRQAQTSNIVMNAHKINRGIRPELNNRPDSDFFFIEEETENVAKEIVKLVKDRLPGFCQTDANQIQVLTPMRNGGVGTESLNILLQGALNPEFDAFGNAKPAMKRGNTVFRLGDKVMQIRNNYEKMVFNGDIGFICDVDEEDEKLFINFGDMPIEYDKNEMDEIVHAWATTIHKSQGSEYPVVVMPIVKAHYVMLQRNLLYTAVTRAKKTFVMIGQSDAVDIAVRNVTVNKRNTFLKYRIQEAKKKDEDAINLFGADTKEEDRE